MTENAETVGVQLNTWQRVQQRNLQTLRQAR